MKLKIRKEFRLDPKLVKWLEEYAVKSQRTETSLIEQGLRQLIKYLRCPEDED